jgi:tetratricopeptide (TPR) repeat protein
MRVMALSGNAMYETDVERRLTALGTALEFMESVKDDQDAAEAIGIHRGLVLGSIAAALMARRDGVREQNRSEAIAFYKRALQHFVDHGDRPNIAKTKYNLADAYGAGVSSDERSEGRLALSYLREVISETSPSAGGAIGLMARLNFATLAARLFGDADNADFLEEAIVNVEEVLAVASSTELRGLRSAALNTLGALYSKREVGDRKQNLLRAIGFLEESLYERPRDECPEDWSTTRSNLLSLKQLFAQEFSSEEVDGEAANLLALKEQRIADLDNKGRPLLAAGERISLAKELIWGPSANDETRNRAREVIASALATFGDLGAVSDAVQALHLLHVADYKLKDFLKAAFHGWQALILSEDLEKGGAELERVRDLSEQMKGLAARVAMLFLPFGETAAALDAIERDRARYLRSTLRQRSSSEGDRIEVARARARVFAFENEARSGSMSSERLEAFVAARADLAELEKEDGATESSADDNVLRRTWRVVERLMNTYSALIVPVFDGGHYAIVVLALQGQELRAAVAFGEHDLHPTLELWNSANWDDPELRKATIDTVATNLWEIFGLNAVQGLMRREIPIGSRVAIVPQGEFGQLPLTLARHAESGAMLSEMFEFSLSPSIAELDRALLEPEVPTLAAVINPTDDLPFAPAEAINCRVVFNRSGNATSFLLGSDCTKDAVLATLQTRSHWLFSAHGMFDPTDMRGSGLQLAGGESLSLDALLQITDIKPPRLVVLSSCDTGHHMVGTAADEFIGLPLGFLQLGAGGVLAALWPVSDVATVFFVSAFMTSHILHGNRPAFALQDGQHWLRNATAAQIQAIAADFITDDIPSATRSALQELNRRLSTVEPSEKVFHHPYFWGGFVLYGA